MKFSNLDRRITVEQRQESQDAGGGVVTSWSVWESFWASRRNVTGEELEKADQRLAEADTVFTVRYSTKSRLLTPTHRILARNQYFNIEAAVASNSQKDSDARPDQIEIYCKYDATAAVAAGIGSMDVGGGFVIG